MVFSYEEKIIIKYLRQKYNYGPTRIVDDHPEYNWNVNGVKTLLKKIDETGDVQRKEGSGRPKTARTEENVAEVEEMILSQEDKPGTHLTPTEIAYSLDIDRRSVSRIIHHDLDLRPVKKQKVQKLSDVDIQKRFDRAKYLLSLYTPEMLETAFFSDEKIFKVKQQYNSHNDVVYIPKKMKKSEVPDEKLFREHSGFPQKIMVSVAISKAGKTSLLFVDPGAKVDADYYCNHLLSKMIPEMNRITKGQEYLFMQDGARSHTAQLTLSKLQKRKNLYVLAPHYWPPNSPDLNPVDFCIWGVLEQNVYRGRRITDLDSLKDALLTEWKKLPQELINKCIDSFRPRLRRVIEVGGRHIEKY